MRFCEYKPIVLQTTNIIRTRFFNQFEFLVKFLIVFASSGKRLSKCLPPANKANEINVH